MLVGCLIVIAAVAATIATGTLLEVKAFTDALKESPQLKLGDELAHANRRRAADAAADWLRQAGKGGNRLELAAALGHDDARAARSERVRDDDALGPP